MLNLYDSGDFNWCLFIGHLVLEKLLKALYIKNIDEKHPITHDLLRLAESLSLELNEEKKDILDTITTFNISVRYPDYNRSFYLKCTPEYTAEYMNKIKELRTWLISMLEKK